MGQSELSARELLTAAKSSPKSWPDKPYTVVAIDPAPDFIGVTGAAFRITAPQMPGKLNAAGLATSVTAGSVTYGSLHSADMRDVWSLCGDESGGCPDVIILELFETGGRVDKFMIGTIQSVGGWIAMAYKCGAMLYLHYPSNRYATMDLARQTVAQHHARDGRKVTHETRHEIDATAHLHAWEMLIQHPGKWGMTYEPDPTIEWAYHMKKVKG